MGTHCHITCWLVSYLTDFGVLFISSASESDKGKAFFNFIRKRLSDTPKFARPETYLAILVVSTYRPCPAVIKKGL